VLHKYYTMEKTIHIFPSTIQWSRLNTSLLYIRGPEPFSDGGELAGKAPPSDLELFNLPGDFSPSEVDLARKPAEGGEVAEVGSFASLCARSTASFLSRPSWK
jgi:hypothetical protein